MMNLKILFLSLAVITLPMLSQAEEDKPFMVLSPVMENGKELPVRYSCNGSSVNPPLEVYNMPPKAKSWALTVQDLDAPEGVAWTHWIVYNIPPDKISLKDNYIPGIQLLNDFGNYAYNGFCPIDDRKHRLLFRAYALDVFLESNEGWMIKDLEKAMRGHLLAKSDLQVVFKKPSL